MRDNLLGVAAPDKETRAPRTRMTGSERRHQLIDIARSLFAERGYEGTSIEEIALRANVSKPVVYEHFGGKEGLYAVVVDREMSALLDGITSSLTNNRSRVRVERVALALLTYVEERTDGFRIMIRDSPASISSGTYSSLLNDAVSQVSSILAGDFARRGNAVIMISSDLPEILGMSDRVLVMRRGRVTALLDRADATAERVLHAATHA